MKKLKFILLIGFMAFSFSASCFANTMSLQDMTLSGYDEAYSVRKWANQPLRFLDDVYGYKGEFSGYVTHKDGNNWVDQSFFEFAMTDIGKNPFLILEIRNSSRHCYFSNKTFSTYAYSANKEKSLSSFDNGEFLDQFTLKDEIGSFYFITSLSEVISTITSDHLGIRLSDVWFDDGEFGSQVFAKNAWILSSSANPVPEPATMLLFGIGLISLAGMSRKNILIKKRFNK